MKKFGTVYLVGAGPGDLQLATLRARACLQMADVVVYDNLANRAYLDWCASDCERIYVGKEAGRHTLPQEEIGATLVNLAKDGKTIVRLKGGDPFVFGRGGEEMESLREAKIPYEIVPGVTAALASAAYTGIPLSHREHSSAITFLTGHENPEKHTLSVNFKAHAQAGGTLCIYMGIGQLPRIVSELKAGGLPGTTPTAVVQWATLPRQRSLITSLDAVCDEVDAAGMGAPAVIIVGDVVRLREPASWFENRPLFGKRLVVTRARAQAGELSSMLETLGADVIELPLIEIQPKMDRTVVAEIFAEIASYEWLVFTSANGVHYFFETLMKAFSDIRCLGPARIAVVGKATARALRKYHISVDVQPSTATADALAKELIATGSMESTRVLIITGNRNRPELMRQLEDVGGAIVDTLPLYATELVDLADDPAAARFREEGADAVLFTSTSTVKSFIQSAKHLELGPNARKPALASIGPVTSKALKAAKLPLAFEAKDANLETFVDTCVAHFGAAQN